MSDPVRLALVWHMHQPDYRDPATGVASLPWVRLHAAKDYVDMAVLAERHPALRLTFNLTPVLLEQLEAAAAGAPELYADLAARPVAALTPAERLFLVRYAFMTSWERHVDPHPRYRELLDRRGRVPPEAVGPEAAARFAGEDLADLVALFMLSWTDRHWDEREEWLPALRAKGRGYDDHDAARLLDLHRRIAGEVVPAYRRLAASGQAELATTPYFHPISPLLLDQAAAREARPGVPLPSPAFDGARDAAWQLDQALASHARRFGAAPAGVWPAEGGVSEAFVALAAARGVRWLATDEEVLRASLGAGAQAGGPGRPWLAGTGERSVAVFFRDHYLSDLVGFVYSRWDPRRAAADFAGRVKEAGARLAADGSPALVTIILDGENAWESYEDDGRPFLEALYEAVTTDPGIETTTPSAWLAAHPPEHRLKRLVAGSWINHDFSVWIGHPEDRRAWELVAAARRLLLDAEPRLAPETFAEAWRHLMIAEGSDWCWWYGEEHYTPIAHEFDRLFRAHVARIHELVTGEAPPELLNPIKERRTHVAFTPARDRLTVTVDGRATTYFEWLAAGRFTPAEAASEMHRAESIIEAIRFGLTPAAELCLRLDAGTHRNLLGTSLIEVEVVRPLDGLLRLAPGPAGLAPAWEPSTPAGPAPAGVRAALDSVVEVVVEPPAGTPVDAAWSVAVRLRDPATGSILERWPATGHLLVEPPATENAADWVV